MKRFNLKKSEKGFTLVELIVVLVILAILATLLVPALTGYIDKAKEKTLVSECRSAVVACQTLASEYYGESGGVYASSAENRAAVESLAELKANTVTSFTVSASGKVTGLVYTNGKIVTYAYTNGTSKYTVSSIS